ncbi:MAG TPA: patatin-like phospholipase family protein [Actinomycetota bacterium]
MNARMAAAGSRPDAPETASLPFRRRTLRGLRRWLMGGSVAPPRHIEALDERSVEDGRVWQRYVHRPDKGRLGVSCSGGGIRSASYNLGVLQVLRERAALGATDYVAAVSGGSYIATAHAITAGFSPDPDLFTEASQPWAPGSPEEEHLRNNTTYLAPGFAGRLWMLLWVTAGLVRHLAPLLAASAIAGLLIGRGYERWLAPSGVPALPSLGRANLIVIGLVSVALALVLLRQIAERAPEAPDWLFPFLQAWALRVTQVAFLAAVFGLLLPWVLTWLPARDVAGGLRLPEQFAGIGGLIAAGKAVSALAQRAEVKRLVPLIATVVGYAALAAPALVAAHWVLRTADARAEGTAFLILALILVFFWVFTDAVQPTAHVYYKDRLARAFVRVRGKDADPPPFQRSAEPPWAEDLRFSRLEVPPAGYGHVPKLVICATVNLSDAVIPPGRGGASFTFEQDRSGGPLTGYVPTGDLEAKAGTGVLTMPAMMAISGAAVSPAMGKLSKPGMRLLLSLFNVRLGVWLPNPLRFGSIESAGRLPIPSLDGEGGAGRPPQPWKRPGPKYVLKEAFGLTRLTDRYVYVTDGGHWENLGLVELLRRGCGRVVCVDAAGDKAGQFRTFGQAVALARSELGIEIHIKLDALRPMKDGKLDPQGVAEQAWAEGTIVYPDGTKGVIVYVRCVATEGMPQDAVAYRSFDPRFPTHSTGDQFFDDQQFESYRSLGRAHATGAVDALSAWLADQGIEGF